MMRISILATMIIGTVAVAAPARAQTYDPAYPICMQVFGKINYFDCRFTSIPQCAVSASGRGARCVVNPYYAGDRERPRRRHRYAY
jgi:hypothetical protein